MNGIKATLQLCLTLGVAAAAAAEPLEVVTTLPAYASIAQFVGGDRVTASAISRGDEDSHFVKPKPSFALRLKDADLFVTTGLDLELWAPTLVDKSGNRRIRDGLPGFVSAAQGVPLLDVPASVSREAGDVHVYGNPHIHTSPLNAKQIAANIAAGLKRVDPGGASAYDAGLAEFERRIDEALYGAELVEILGAETLDPLARQGRLIEFLDGQQLDGTPLTRRLGGWMGRGLAFRGEKIIAYHKNWIYFTDLFGLQVVNFVERKPGIPPSARHVHDLIEQIRNEKIEVLLAASYFSADQTANIADRTGARAVVVPLGPMETGGEAYFELIDGWISALSEAFGRTDG